MRHVMYWEGIGCPLMIVHHLFIVLQVIGVESASSKMDPFVPLGANFRSSHAQGQALALSLVPDMRVTYVSE